MGNKIKKFGVVIVLYGDGAGKVIQNYLDAFKILLEMDVPVILVDHGAHFYGPADFVGPNIIFLNQENKGFGSGINLGCQAAFKCCEYAIVLNPDLNFSVYELLSIGNGLDAQFHVIETREHGNMRAIRYFNKITGLISDKSSFLALPYFNGAAFCISKSLFEFTKGFDENFFLYFEDIDFSMRLRQLSIPLKIIKAKTFVHEVGGSSGGDRILIQKIAARSALRLTRKWFPWSAFLYIRYSLKWLLAKLQSHKYRWNLD
jgi:GT2 family glycosyltransferase